MLSFFKVEKIRIGAVAELIEGPTCAVAETERRTLRKRHLTVYGKRTVCKSVNNSRLLVVHTQSVKTRLGNVDHPCYRLTGDLPVGASYIIEYGLDRAVGGYIGRAVVSL